MLETFPPVWPLNGDSFLSHSTLGSEVCEAAPAAQEGRPASPAADAACQEDAGQAQTEAQAQAGPRCQEEAAEEDGHQEEDLGQEQGWLLER